MFTLDAKALNTNLSFIKRAAGFSLARSRSLPVETRAVRIEADAQHACVSWFDYEVSVELWQPAEGTGSVAIDIVELSDALKAVGARGTASFTVDGDKVCIGANGVAVYVDALNPNDLPAMPRFEPGSTFVCSASAFSDAAKAVASSVGKDMTLPMLTGVRVENSEGKVAMAATDRFRLAVAKVPHSHVEGDEFAALVPGKVLAEVGKFVAKAETVTATVVEGMAVFDWITGRVSTRLLDAEFPRIDRLFPDPDDYTTTFTLPAAATAKQLKAVAKARQVRLNILDDVVAETDTATVRLDAGEVVSYGMAVAFNPEYLASILAAAPKGVKVSVGMTTPNRPAVIEWDNVRALLMPVRLPG